MISTITSSNTKHQVVIPGYARRAKNLAYLKILKSTQGAWAGDNWPETEAKQRKIELKAVKELLSL